MEIQLGRTIYQIEDPNRCPHCHNGIHPGLRHKEVAKSVLYSLWICPINSCNKLFVTAHKLKDFGLFEFIGFLDGSPIPPIWPDTILNLKSKFIDTYNQSLKAEQLGLDEIAGMGFRKAIEYLVKDYIISKK